MNELLKRWRMWRLKLLETQVIPEMRVIADHHSLSPDLRRSAENMIERLQKRADKLRRRLAS